MYGIVETLHCLKRAFARVTVESETNVFSMHGRSRERNRFRRASYVLRLNFLYRLEIVSFLSDCFPRNKKIQIALAMYLKFRSRSNEH